MADNKTKEIQPDEFKLYRELTQILLVTANKNELNAVKALLEPVKDNVLHKYTYTWRCSFLIKQATYIFGKFGAFKVAVQKLRNQGSAAAQDAVTIASTCFDNLDAIFAVGVACGVNTKSNLLDVLVSKKISCYNLIETSAFFIECFENKKEWQDKQFPKAKKRMALILSGDFLVDNKEFRDQLINKYEKDAIGIEMEGGGLIHEYKQNNCEIMIVKAVSDLGDGYKDKRYEPTAALLAARCLKHYLNDVEMPDKLKCT